MTKRFLSALSCTILLAACKNRENATSAIIDPLSISPKLILDNTQHPFHQKALNDYNKKELKYYFQSIHSPSRKTTTYLKDALNITIKSASDHINSDYTAYNQTVDSIVFAQKGIHIDSLLNAKRP